jgi:DNA-binding winged helix-turn-helix (wHTH) protein
MTTAHRPDWAAEVAAMQRWACDSEALTFGPFKATPSQRRLEKCGRPVPLTDQQLDILFILLKSPGTVVLEEMLIARVWGKDHALAGKAALRCCVAELRSALGDGKRSSCYIVTLPGRGYVFVAPIYSARDRKREERFNSAREAQDQCL